MFGPPKGLKEISDDNPDDTIEPVTGLFKNGSRKKRKQSTKKRQRIQLEDWWYGEVIWWRLLACYFWLILFFIMNYCFIIFPFSILSLYNTVLLFFCSCLIMFGQQTLRSSWSFYFLQHSKTNHLTTKIF